MDPLISAPKCTANQRSMPPMPSNAGRGQRGLPIRGQLTFALLIATLGTARHRGVRSTKDQAKITHTMR